MKQVDVGIGRRSNEGVMYLFFGKDENVFPIVDES